MAQITKKCETCNGEGVVKIDELGELHNINISKVYDNETGELLKLKEKICPDCDGLGEIDFTDDYYSEKADEYIKNQKER